MVKKVEIQARNLKIPMTVEHRDAGLDSDKTGALTVTLILGGGDLLGEGDSLANLSGDALGVRAAFDALVLRVRVAGFLADTLGVALGDVLVDALALVAVLGVALVDLALGTDGFLGVAAATDALVRRVFIGDIEVSVLARFLEVPRAIDC